MQRKFLVPVLFMAVLCSFSSCYYDTGELLYPGGTACTGTTSYATQVAPLIQSRCAMSGCHSSGVTNTGGPLTTYAQIKAKATAIKATVLNGSMPKGSSFTADQIKIISCWVDNGAPNN